MSPFAKPIFASILFLAIVGPNVHAQTTLRYQHKAGESLNYVMEQKMKSTVTVMGMDVETTMEMKMDLAWTVKKTDDKGNAELLIKVNRVKMMMGLPTGNIELDSQAKEDPNDEVGKILSQLVKALAAMEMSGTISTTGDLKNFKINDEAMKAFKNLPGANAAGDSLSPDSFKTLISNIVFPVTPVSKGKTWTHKIEVKNAIGKATTENTYTYEGPTKKDGATLEKIAIKPNIKIEADPDAKVKVNIKEIKGSGFTLFNNGTGQMVETTINQRSEFQITTQGINLDQVVDQTTTIRLKK